VLWVSPGERLEKGQRVGLIRFGSRVDVDLPSGGRPAVAIGDKLRAGETVIARLD
jgi:phosphatidylserine decarboxylase